MSILDGKESENREGHFQLTVCRFGTAEVYAGSEEEAKAKAMEMKPDQIRWSGEDGKTPPFLAAYAERAE